MPDSPIIEDLGNAPEALDTFRLVTESAPAMLWMGDEAGKCLFLNKAQRQFWGVRFSDLETFSWAETLHPDDAETVYSAFNEGMANRSSFACEARYRRASDGDWRWLRTQAQPRFDADRQFVGMIGVNTDVTDEKVAQIRQQLLMEELNHRVKNSLASVISIARQTARSATDTDSFVNTFIERIQAMAQTHDLLTAGKWEGADVGEIVENELRPYSGQVKLSGARLNLPPQRAVSLSLIVHELATNSAKYGALAKPGEPLHVSWTVEEGCGILDWREHSTTSNAGAKPGFGTRLIQSLAEGDLGGAALLGRDGDGFRAEIRFATT
ncbi:MAG: sensor histidine kinase [Caulobacteraceae bacterium]